MRDDSRRHVAAIAIGVGVLSNTLRKLTLTVVLSSPALTTRAGAGLVALATGLGLLLTSTLPTP